MKETVKNKTNKELFILFLFLLFRTALTLPTVYYGLKDETFSFSADIPVLILISVLFPVLITLLIGEVKKICGNSADPLLLLLIASPAFIVPYFDPRVLLLSCVALILIICTIKTKTHNKINIFLLIALFLFGLIEPKSLLAFGSLAISMQLFIITNAEHKKPAVLTLIFSALTATAGALIHIPLSKLTFFKNLTAKADTYYISSGNDVLFYATPIIFFLVYYAALYFIHKVIDSKSGKGAKAKISKRGNELFWNAESISFLAYTFAVVGFFVSAEYSLVTIFVIPVFMVIEYALLRTKENEYVLEDSEKIIKKHYGIFIVILILLNLLTLYYFYTHNGAATSLIRYATYISKG